jgi:ketosteroid isomerase-like protein
MTTTYSRDEVEEAFRHYFLTGPVLEDWSAWSQLFSDDAVYFDHFYGRFRGPEEIQKFLESTMGFAPHVYSPLEWYNLDGNRIVYKVWNRADNPDAGGPPAEFPSLQIVEYAGDGRWSSEEDWWLVKEM